MELDVSSPMVDSTSSMTFSASALGRSILFTHVIISRLFSNARYTLAMVWASTPCDASTTSSAPSQAARLRETEDYLRVSSETPHLTVIRLTTPRRRNMRITFVAEVHMPRSIDEI